MRTWLTIAIACLLFADDLSAQVKLLSRRPTSVVYPNDISNLEIWLKPESLSGENGVEVETWPDSSGNGYDATNAAATSKPILTNNVILSYEGLMFDTVNDFLMFKSDANGIHRNKTGSTIFAVRRCDQADASLAAMYAASRNSKTSTRVAIVDANATTGNIGGRRLDADSYATSDAFNLLTVTHALTVIANWGNSEVFVYTNSVQQLYDSTWLTDGSTSDTDSVDICIGTLSGDGTYAWKGMLSELIVYSRALSADEIVNVHSYLKEKYGLW